MGWLNESVSNLVSLIWLKEAKSCVPWNLHWKETFDGRASTSQFKFMFSCNDTPYTSLCVGAVIRRYVNTFYDNLWIITAKLMKLSWWVNQESYIRNWNMNELKKEGKKEQEKCSYTRSEAQTGANLILRLMVLLSAVPCWLLASHWYGPLCVRDTRCRTNVWLLCITPKGIKGRGANRTKYE